MLFLPIIRSWRFELDPQLGFAFIVVAVVSIVTPGPDTLLALSNGSRFGLKRASWGIWGCVVADILLIAIVATGLGALFAASPSLFNIVKWIGVAYLAYLGVHLFQTSGTLDLDAAVQKRDSETGRATFLKGITIALSNPKNYLFFAALLPQFVSPDYPQTTQYFQMTLIVVAIDILALAAYAYFGSRIALLFKSSAIVWFDRLCGTTFLVLSALLALWSL